MRLKDEIQTATVSQLNNRKPVVMKKTATVREAVVKMREAHLGCVIVVDDDLKVIGLFTEAMLRHALNDGPEVIDEVLEHHMATRVPWVLPTDEVKLVLDAMEEHNIRFIAVVDTEHHVVALSGQKTLIEFIAEFFAREIYTQDPTGIESSVRREGA